MEKSDIDKIRELWDEQVRKCKNHWRTPIIGAQIDTDKLEEELQNLTKALDAANHNITLPIGNQTPFEKACDDLFAEFQDDTCNHDWMPIQLAVSTVYNCRKCGIKKEDVEK